MALVWVMAFALAVSYYQLPTVAKAASGLQTFRLHTGLLFPICAGFIAGGVLPEFAKILTRSLAKGENVIAEAGYRGLVWSGLGVMVDEFYKLQAVWFGTGHDPRTLVCKTLVDMFVFAPTVFVPYAVGMFIWKRERFKLPAPFSAWSPQVWKSEVLPTYVPNVCFWIIVLLAVYALPTDLQYPMSALATACWSILFTFLQRRPSDQECKT